MIGRLLRGVKDAKFEAYQVPYLANQRLANLEHIITPQDVRVHLSFFTVGPVAAKASTLFFSFPTCLSNP